MGPVHFLLYSAYNPFMIQRRKGSVKIKKEAMHRLKTVKRPVGILRLKKKSTSKQSNSVLSPRVHSISKSKVTVRGRCVDLSSSSVRPIGTPMHPYMRTMFLSLAVGTVGVFASMLYYIHIAHATETSLFGSSASRITAEKALASVDGVFTGLIKDLEVQRTNAGGALPIPPREYLRLRSEQAGVDYDLLNHIAYCESHWRMVDNAKSTASGYFQILDGTEQLTPQYRAGLRKTDPYVNIDMAISLYQKYGTIPWTESQSCWSKFE